MLDTEIFLLFLLQNFDFRNFQILETNDVFQFLDQNLEYTNFQLLETKDIFLVFLLIRENMMNILLIFLLLFPRTTEPDDRNHHYSPFCSMPLTR